MYRRDIYVRENINIIAAGEKRGYLSCLVRIYFYLFLWFVVRVEMVHVQGLVQGGQGSVVLLMDDCTVAKLDVAWAYYVQSP